VCESVVEGWLLTEAAIVRGALEVCRKADGVGWCDVGVMLTVVRHMGVGDWAA
jgi:hypothetical protein